MGLKHKKIAIFLADYYGDVEFWYLKIRMKEEGGDITVTGPRTGVSRGTTD